MTDLSRRDLIQAASAVATTTLVPSIARGTAVRSGTTQIGLDGVNYYQGFCPFINWWKIAGFNNLTTTDRGNLYLQANWQTNFIGHLSGTALTTTSGGSNLQIGDSVGGPGVAASTTIVSGSNPNWVVNNSQTVGSSGSPVSLFSIYGQPYLDPNGDIIVPTARVRRLNRIFLAQGPAGPFQLPQMDYSGERFTVSWDGSASVQVLAPPGSINVGPHVTSPFTCTLGTFLTAWNVSLDLGITNPNDPPRNIKVYQTRYASALAAGKTFNPDWLAQARQFGVLRFMDWMATNNNTITDFSQMADENYWAWGQPFNTPTTNGNFGPKGGMHPELICRLLNETGCRGHVCIPVAATDALVAAFATYFRDHTNQIIDYEFSNECWNFGFDQAVYCQAKGVADWRAQDLSRGDKWYGYQASRFMKIIRDVYNDRARWKGVLGTQTVSPAVTFNHLVGVNYWRASVPANSLQVSDIFDDVHVTGYFGDDIVSLPVNSLTAANPGVVTTVVGSGVKTGAELRIFVNAGAIQLNNTKVTATVLDNTHFSIGVDTTGMGRLLANSDVVTAATMPNSPTYSNGTSGIGATLTASSNAALLVNGASVAVNNTVVVKNQAAQAQNGIYTVTDAGSRSTPWVLTRATSFDQAAKMIRGCASTVGNTTYVLNATVTLVGIDAIVFDTVGQLNNYYVPSKPFDLMDQSAANNASNPALYPTLYTYFNQQLATSLQTGTCSFGYTTSLSVASLNSTYWPAQKAIAAANGLGLRQYEGGFSFYGIRYITFVGGNSQLNEFMADAAMSSEIAGVYTASYAQYKALGGKYASKFVEAGVIGVSGAWTGFRYLPLASNRNTNDFGNPVWQAVLAANRL